ncbi:MAG TPA: PqiC family protein [Dissulfurispiraceae bacterium]|nr:PqiC family protein [Dissulfurispiraceae bacterium]
MKQDVFDRRLLCIAVIFVAVLTGCFSSTPSRFYQLSSLENQTKTDQDVQREHAVIVSIGPLRLPDYLEGPQIVTRSGRNELKFAEFDRWAGSLESDIVRVLVENIAALLPADQFSVTRWSPSSESRAPSAYMVEVRVDRFEGTLGGSVSLRAKWVLYAKDKDPVLKRETIINENANGSSYNALVEAMSSALERMSHDIADGIRSAVPENK